MNKHDYTHTHTQKTDGDSAINLSSDIVKALKGSLLECQMRMLGIKKLFLEKDNIKLTTGFCGSKY